MRYGIAQRPFVQQWRIYLFVILLTAAIILAYRPAWNGGFLWDDDAYVTNNELLTAADGLRRIWFSFDSPSQYFPLVYTTFRFEHACWGLNPTGYHVVNILLHLANALLLWRLLERLRIPGACLAAAIFALHPVQVESVAWITERKNVLMGFFYLLTLLAWVEFIDLEKAKRWEYYAAALFFYLLALSAKSTACTLPAALLLILWLKKRPINKERLVRVVPFLVLGTAMGLLTVWWERYHQGTRGPLFALGPIERILIASRAVWFYLGKLFWPSNLTFIYPRWMVSPTHLLDYAWLAAGGGACAAIALARKHVGRSLEVAALYFVATLSPVIGFIMLYTFRYTFVADHYQYLASIGPIALASAGVATLAAAFKESRRFILGAGVCILVALAMLSWRQSTMYADIEALWRTTIARNPDCWMAHNNLGIVLAQKNEIDEAIAHYGKTLEMSPDFADADYNLGSALLQKGEIDAAILHCQRAVTIQPNDPEAQVGLGNALFQKGLIDESIVHYQKALAIRPYYVTAHYNVSSAFLKKGEIDEAIFHCQAVLSAQPEHADAHTILASAFLQKGEIGTAIEQYKKTLEIAPRSVPALNNLAWILATYSDPAFRDGTKALELAQRANEFSGRNNPIILRTLAAAHANAGQFSKAVEVGQLALSLTDWQSALGNALQKDIAGYQAGLPYRENTNQ